MLSKEEIELFLDKNVSIGVPHSIMEGQLFFYYGRLIYVDFDEIKLETKNGFKIVPIKMIQDIHEDRRKYG